jgi:hypothetical protein
MQREKILLLLDQEISQLQQARKLLAGGSPANASVMKRKPGRPAGSGKLSAEGRKKIAEAMKRSWAERKKHAAALEKG